MVENQIIARGVTSTSVLTAMRKVPRQLFMPEDSRDLAYEDYPVPIGYNQTISQPYIVAFMSEAACIEPTNKVLEIGTGCGYQTAVLAELAESVCTIEIVKKLAEPAAERLKNLGYSNIKTKIGDGGKGWETEAPFDVILVTAAPPIIPQTYYDQLKMGGRLIIPVGTSIQELVRVVQTDKGFEQERLLPVRFVPLVQEN